MSEQSSGPWWKFPHMWLVVGGPAVVVVASFVTLYLAITRPDPVTDTDYYRKGIEINKTLNDNASSMAPALRTGSISKRVQKSSSGS